MTKNTFDKKLVKLLKEQRLLLSKKNKKTNIWNGIYDRYQNSILTEDHVPINWSFDLSHKTNPNLQVRMGVNSVYNAGAIEFKGKICLAARIEGNDRKSFFAIAESKNGIDNFKFWDYPITMPETKDPDTNIYDVRLVKHEDGWIYGVFCVERKDPKTSKFDQSSAISGAGIARTKDLKKWERLGDLETPSPQQRDVVLHPEFVNGKYAFYTRPQDGFIDVGSGSGIAWGLSDSIEKAKIKKETVIYPRLYHTVGELKNGQGGAPIKTKEGWLHLAHSVRNNAAGLRYTLFMFMTSLEDPTKVIYKPGGHFMAPMGDEFIGDVGNVLFVNGWVKKKNDDVLIYYASSDKRMHVATSTVDKLIDYVKNTPEDGLGTAKCVEQRKEIISKNLGLKK